MTSFTSYRIYEDNTVVHQDDFDEDDREQSVQCRDFRQVMQADGNEQLPEIIQYLENQ